MKAEMWMKTGMIIAVMGACTLADAKPESETGGADKESSQSGKFEKGQKGGGKGRNREATMKKYDKDGNGQLSDAELQTLKADRAMQREKREGEKGPREGKPEAKRPNRDEMIKKFDKDGDGQLNDAERSEARKAMGDRAAPGRRQEMMKKFDADGNGELSEEERATARAAYEEKRKERENAATE